MDALQVIYVSYCKGCSKSDCHNFSIEWLKIRGRVFNDTYYAMFTFAINFREFHEIVVRNAFSSFTLH